MPAATDDRLEALEAAVGRVEAAVAQASVDAERRAAEAAKTVTDNFAATNANLLSLSQTLNSVQAQVSKWAAAGALLGSVILFIAVRALGL